MFTIIHATMADKPHFVNKWENLPESEYESKIRDKRCYAILFENERIGYMRYNLQFDFIPLLTCFYIADPHKGKGFGRKAMEHWEDEMRSLGFKMIMVSAEAGENAHHFYRKLGYKDMGSIILGGILPLEQETSELFLGKAL